MTKPTFLAGKIFKITSEQSKGLSKFGFSNVRHGQYIQFAPIANNGFTDFNILNRNKSLIKSAGFTDPGLRALFVNSTPINLSSINSKGKTNMGLSTLVKKLLDKDLKAMHKLGYVDSDLTLTDTGTDWLLAELFMTNKTELGKVARLELAEKDKSKKCKK